METPEPSSGVNIWEIPAITPPPGVVPNLVNPDCDGWVAIPIASAFLVVMYVVLGLKIYCCAAISGGCGLGDYWVFASAIGSTFQYIYVVLSVVITRYGTHMWDLPLRHFLSDAFIKLAFVANFSHLISLTVKLTFMVLYLRIFGPFRWMRWLCWFGIGFTTVFYVAMFFAQMYLSTPAPGETWLENFTSPSYVHQTTLNPIAGIGGLIIDIYIFLLPVCGVSRLQMTPQVTRFFVGVFAVGLLAVAASATTLVYREKMTLSRDYTYENYVVGLTIFIEFCAGTTCAALPSLAMIAHHPKTKARWKKLIAGLPGAREEEI